ncbi:MAG: CvpA family protein [Fibrobacter sp.]|nr:CvpA family protein [Fibrobacter sp.]
MIWIDIVCLVCLLVFILIGLWRGMLKSIFRLCAWVGGIVGAYVSQGLLANTIAANLELSGFTVRLVCICIGFIVPFLGFILVGHLTNKAVSGTAVSKVNRILGAFLGFIKAYLLCCVLLTILHILPVSGNLKEARDNSVSYAVYKVTLETMGFSSEEVDLVGIAEKKATELSKEITEKAVEKAKEEATQAAEAVKDSIVDAAKTAADSIKKASQNAAKKVRKKTKRAIDEEGDKIEYDDEDDIPIDE